MHILLRIVGVAVAFGFGGCSIYPLPEDVTGFTSDQISTIVRCQTRDAIREEIIENIVAIGDRVAYEKMRGPELVARLREDPSEFRRLVWTKFSKELKGPFLFYKDTSISFDFTIDSTETNNTGMDLTLLKQMTGRSDKIGVTAKNDRTREVKRHFRVFDSFDSLARLLTESTCNLVPQNVNALYPVTGQIKIRSLVKSFLLANQLGNLGGEAQDYSTAQMTDTITFTTKFTGNVDPSFQVSPVANRFVPSNLGFNVDNTRQDIHTIIILIRLPSNTSGLPRFDEIGRLTLEKKGGGTLSKKETQRAVSSDALDRQREFNTQDAIIQIGTGLNR